MCLQDYDITQKIGKKQILKQYISNFFIFISKSITGKGYYSTIYQVKHKISGNIFALKKIKMNELSEYE